MLAWRGLSVVVGLVFAACGVILIVVIVELLDGPLCADVAYEEECFDGSSGDRVVSSVIGIPTGLMGVATLGASIYFASTGRRNRLLLIIGAGALGLTGLLALAAQLR